MRHFKLLKPVLILFAISVFMGTSCSRKMHRQTVSTANKETTKEVNKKETNLIISAENKADIAGKAILKTGRKMAVIDKTIIKGSCWDYINAVYKKAGYGTNKKIVYKSKKSGPYADVSKIKPGDWIYYVNHSYGGVEHSGIFVYWKDYKKKIGVTLSYGGEKRNEPGRYLPYDLKSVYYITRAGAK